MAIRQIRHLHEKPSDFLRLPVFIIVSTLFLMPIRLLGFLRMAHASGWGTRAGAYAGGGDDLIAELERPRTARPTWSTAHPPASCRPSAPPAPDGTVLTASPGTRAHPSRRGARPGGIPRTRRRLNPLAAIPYGIALVIFALEALVYV